MIIKNQAKKISSLFFFAVILSCSIFNLTANAQDVTEASSYYLPKTAIDFTILIEKTTCEPGDLNMYAERFLKKNDVATKPSTSYRILNIKMINKGIPDTTKLFTPAIDTKHSITSLKVDEQGIIMAVNAETPPPTERKAFAPAPKPEPLNSRDYLTQDILSAGSKAKMAELTAQEIYDIRDSKSQLNKGLLQLFEGITEKDTIESVITFVPEKDTDKSILFRFSQKFGLTDTDDLSGIPYYIKVDDLHKMVSNTATVEGMKKSKDDANIYANLPGKIKLTLFKEEQELGSQEFYAAQFGKTLPLDNELFGKKLLTSLVYNPTTGNIDTIKTEMLKKQ